MAESTIEQALTDMVKPGIHLIALIEGNREKAGKEFMAMAAADREGVRTLRNKLNQLLSFEESGGAIKKKKETK